MFRVVRFWASENNEVHYFDKFYEETFSTEEEAFHKADKLNEAEASCYDSVTEEGFCWTVLGPQEKLSDRFVD